MNEILDGKGALADAELSALVGPALNRVLGKRIQRYASLGLIKQAAQEGDDVKLTDLLIGFQPQWSRNFYEVNKLVEGNHGTDSVVPRIPGLNAVPLEKYGREGERALELSRDVELRMRAKHGRRGNDRKRKVYALDKFFSDAEVSAKFNLTTVDLQVLKRSAAVDSAAASRNLQIMLKSRGEDCIVIPGSYSQGLKAARSRLHSAVEQSLLPAPDVQLLAIGETAVVQGPISKIDGKPEWEAFGEARVSPEVIAVARLAELQGVQVTRTLFEMDMVICGVTLTDFNRSIGPYVYHSGLHDAVDGVAGTDGTMHSAPVREAGLRVAPLVSGGRVVATAVRQSETTAYANWHVMKDAGDDAPVRLDMSKFGGTAAGYAQLLNEVSSDVWSVQHDQVPLEAGTWVLREPDIGEWCVLVYATRSGPEFSDMVEVKRKERGSVIVSKPPQVRPGISGAALVGVTDGALFGVYRGSSHHLCSCAVVLPGNTMATVEFSNYARAGGEVTGTSADDAFARLSSRGLAGVVRKTLESLKMLRDSEGKHVGYMVRHGPSGYTTLDPDIWSLADASGVAVDLERVGPDKFRSTSVAGTTPLSFVRIPRVGESVYIVGSDVEGAYFSKALTVAKLGSDGTTFWLSDCPEGGVSESYVYAGAIVMADSDAAVLGVFSSSVVAGTGTMSKCVGLTPRVSGVMPRSEQVLNAISSGVMTELWEPEAVRGLVVRDEEVLRRYAVVGDQVMRSTVVIHNTRYSAAESNAAAVSVVSHDNWVVARAVDCGFGRVMRPVSGQTVNSDALAEGFRAFIGMLAVFQGMKAVADLFERLDFYGKGWDEQLRDYYHAPPAQTAAGMFIGTLSQRSSPSPRIG